MQNAVAAKISSAIAEDYRNRMNAKINRLPLAYFDGHAAGDTLSRITNDTDVLAQGLGESLSKILTSITTIIGTVIMMFVCSPLMAVIVLAIIPLSSAVIVITVKFSQKYFMGQQKLLGGINGQVEEVFSNHTVVYSCCGQDKAQKAFDETNAELFGSVAKANFFSSVLHPVMNFMSNLSYVVICVVGGYIAVKRADISFVTTIAVFITYMSMFGGQVGNVANISSVLQTNAAASERIYEFLETTEQETENKSRRISQVKGDVEFVNVKFGYDKNKPIIRNFSLKVKAGQKVAIVGPTGAGKTTIVNLLMQFYEIDGGDILIDGVPIKSMSREEVRSFFGMVLQDAWLFEGTVRENIGFGAKDVSSEKIIDACKAAHADGFIRSLPQGYDTVISEKTNISQGQRQLLTIARAMANDFPMIILDEATSSVDIRTEEAIQKAMDEIAKGKTSFVIAHRLSTIKNADIILVLKDGDVIEQGTHLQLLSRGGFYAGLYRSQFSDI